MTRRQTGSVVTLLQMLNAPRANLGDAGASGRQEGFSASSHAALIGRRRLHRGARSASRPTEINTTNTGE